MKKDKLIIIKEIVEIDELKVGCLLSFWLEIAASMISI